MRQVLPSFAHLDRMTDEGGLYEHADHDRPRPEHGYCVDDVARGLVVTCREPDPTTRVVALRKAYLGFVLAAQTPDGRFRNRRATDLTWRDDPSTDDCWGRALWGLGAVVGAGPRTRVLDAARTQALEAFEQGAVHRSGHARAMAVAALGAAQVLQAHPTHPVARDLLADAAALVDPTGQAGTITAWPWPEARLRYGNAALPEVLVLAGHHLDRPGLTRRGLDLLGWLVDVQTRDGHLSVVPVEGLGPDEVGTGPRFDQQPIEVGCLADACATAHALTGDPRWADAVRMAVAWFHGDNDARTSMVDEGTGGGFDGLTPTGRNANQGAESTLAMLSTLQHGLRLVDPDHGGHDTPDRSTGAPLTLDLRDPRPTPTGAR